MQPSNSTVEVVRTVTGLRLGRALEHRGIDGDLPETAVARSPCHRAPGRLAPQRHWAGQQVVALRLHAVPKSQVVHAVDPSDDLYVPAADGDRLEGWIDLVGNAQRVPFPREDPPRRIVWWRTAACPTAASFSSYWPSGSFGRLHLRCAGFLGVQR